MITSNESGSDKGRYLFTVFETGSVGVQRHDLQTGEVATIWQSPSTSSPEPRQRSTPPTGRRGGHSSPPRSRGQRRPEDRRTSVRPAIRAEKPERGAGHLPPLTAVEQRGRRFRASQRDSARTSHEGIQFDRAGNMYFIDELNGGTVSTNTLRPRAAGVNTRQPPTTSRPARRSCCASAMGATPERDWLATQWVPSPT